MTQPTIEAMLAAFAAEWTEHHAIREAAATLGLSRNAYLLRRLEEAIRPAPVLSVASGTMNLPPTEVPA